MTFRPRYLSLEHMGARNYRFRPILGSKYRFTTREWMRLDEARGWLESYSVEQGEYGDMFCPRLSGRNG
jgi:hypothetical protein